MEVKLLHASSLTLADTAIGKCWDKQAKDPKERMYRVGNKNKHSSTLEHINYTWDIDGISRACLQELARHRHQSLSVKSSRYTLKELKDETPFIDDGKYDVVRANRYIVLTPNIEANYILIKQLENLRVLVRRGVANDYAKYAMPECYKTSLVSTMNMRAFQNFLDLRTSKAALWELRELAHKMFKVVPNEHKFMLEEFIHEL